LEQVATAEEKAKGLDIADFVLRLPAPTDTVPAVTTDTVTASTVTTDTHESVVVAVESNSFQELLESDDDVAKCYTMQEAPFCEEIPQISEEEFKRNCEVLDWWNKRLDLPIDGTIIIDGIAFHDIKDVIIKHIEVIHKDNSSAVVSLKFLDKIKKIIT